MKIFIIIATLTALSFRLLAQTQNPQQQTPRILSIKSWYAAADRTDPPDGEFGGSWIRKSDNQSSLGKGWYLHVSVQFRTPVPDEQFETISRDDRNFGAEILRRETFRINHVLWANLADSEGVVRAYCCGYRHKNGNPVREYYISWPQAPDRTYIPKSSLNTLYLKFADHAIPLAGITISGGPGTNQLMFNNAGSSLDKRPASAVSSQEPKPPVTEGQKAPPFAGFQGTALDQPARKDSKRP